MSDNLQTFINYSPIVREYEKKESMINSAMDSVNLTIQLLDYVKSDYLPNDSEFSITKEILQKAILLLHQEVNPELTKAYNKIESLKAPYEDYINQMIKSNYETLRDQKK